ncbi:MAG TPA: sulfatase-like hydrolase/transferase [Myxococcales bacterium]|nr:sulfatase-like hydrolase/transferase [Myxococcales bacterium]
MPAIAARSVGARYRRLLLFALAGAAAGLALFAVETVFVVRSGQAVLDFDATGAAHAAVTAARPALVLLLLRIAVAYCVAGAGVGLAAGALARDTTRTRTGFALLWAADAVVLCGLSAWAACIRRPALFEDIAALRPLLGWIVRHGHPWQPAAAAALVFAAHLPRSQRPARALLRGSISVCAMLIPRAAASLNAPAAPAPLVVLIGIDAFRPDRIEGDSLRRHLAPNLERFLDDAVRFDRAYTPIAQTEPAWAAMLTASWPWRTGVRHPLTSDAQRAALPTLASTFAAASFHTTFATDCSRFNWQGPGTGFESRLQPPRGAVNFALEKLRYHGLGVFVATRLGSWWLPEVADNRALPGFYDPYGYARRLADRLAAEARAGPALFAYHDTVPHYPGDVAYPFYRRHPDAPLRMSYALPGGDLAGREDRARREELYDELLSEADAQLGILLDRLRAEGRYDSALIVVFSDHGEGFQPDLPGLAQAIPVHGARLSDDENRILLAFKPPRGSGISGGRTVHDLVRLIDLAPTVLEASGLPPLAQGDGVSLMPLLRGASLPPLWLYAETGYTHIAPDAFDADHFTGGPRGFDAYRVRAGGAIEMSGPAHDLAMREKDLGAYDGRGWLIRSRRADGTMQTRCRGECAPGLAAWLDRATRSPAAMN